MADEEVTASEAQSLRVKDLTKKGGKWEQGICQKGGEMGAGNLRRKKSDRRSRVHYVSDRTEVQLVRVEDRIQ